MFLELFTVRHMWSNHTATQYRNVSSSLCHGALDAGSSVTGCPTGPRWWDPDPTPKCPLCTWCHADLSLHLGALGQQTGHPIQPKEGMASQLDSRLHPKDLLVQGPARANIVLSHPRVFWEPRTLLYLPHPRRRLIILSLSTCLSPPPTHTLTR